MLTARIGAAPRGQGSAADHPFRVHGRGNDDAGSDLDLIVVDDEDLPYVKRLDEPQAFRGADQ
jgi:hypothetical protein